MLAPALLVSALFLLWWVFLLFRYLKSVCSLDVVMTDLRTLMPMLSHEACAIAGQAVALSQVIMTMTYLIKPGGGTGGYLLRVPLLL